MTYQHLIDSLPQDVCEYFDMPIERFKPFCFESTIALADEWHKRKPETPAEIAAFYQQDWPWYIGDLAWWHTQVEGRQEWFARMVRIGQAFKVRSVLDWGAGICSDALVMAANGFRVTVTDYDNPALKFGEWRAQKYGLKLTVRRLPQEVRKLNRKFDCITAIDVLEHMPDYEEALAGFCRRAWMLVISAPFKDPKAPDDAHPQHLYEKTPIGEILTKRGYRPFEGLFWVKNRN